MFREAGGRATYETAPVSVPRDSSCSLFCNHTYGLGCEPSFPVPVFACLLAGFVVVTFVLLLLIFFKIGSHVPQAGFELYVAKVAKEYSEISLLPLPNAGIIGMN